MKKIYNKISKQFFNCNLCDFVDYLKNEISIIDSENGVNSRIEIYPIESYDGTYDVGAYISYDVEETEAELKRKSDIEKMENRIRVEEEIKALWRLKEKYKDFNANFEDYKA
jgi:hypothetical protein